MHNQIGHLPQSKDLILISSGESAYKLRVLVADDEPLTAEP